VRPAAVSRSHEDAVLDAEVRLLAHKLAPFGVLSEAELARRAEAHLWSSGRFREALRAGTRAGMLELLPGGFVALARVRTTRAPSGAVAAEGADRGTAGGR
jgi:hypothetical protein